MKHPSGRSPMPLRRKKGLEVQKLADEVLVYDLELHRAHGLNKMAAVVWRHCDGKTTLLDTARILEKELAVPADPELVRFVLARLGKARLLEGSANHQSVSGRYTRREFVHKLRKLGLAATVALPVVTSIVAPTPAHAQTCVPYNGCAGLPNCTPCVGPGGNCGNWKCCNGQCTPPGQAASQCGC